MRKARAIGRCLEPLSLFYWILAAKRGLDVNRLGDVGITRLSDVVLGKIISFGKFLDLVAERWVWLAGLPVRVKQLWVLHVIKMNVGIDEINFGHSMGSSWPATRGCYQVSAGSVS